MKICTETESWMPCYTVEETFRQLSEAGFDGVDLSLCAREGKQWLDSPDYLRQAVHVRDSARAFNLPILQAHPPIFEALHETGYRGCFTYEANSFLTRFPAAA